MDRMKISFALLWSYLWVLFVLQSITVDVKMTVIFGIFLGGLSFFTSYLVFRLFAEKISGFDLEADGSHGIVYGIGIASITFLLFMVYFAGQYPGGMGADTIKQYAQALGEMPYNDWHPVLHTLLFLTIPVKMGRGFAFLVFLQLVYFSLAFGYLGYVLRRNQCPGLFLICSCIYIWINPYMVTYMVYPWKDIALTIFAIILMAYDIQIMCSQGEWLRVKRNLILFAVVSVVCAYMRHNAILFVAPLVLVVLFYAVKDRKLRVAVILSLVVCFLAVKLLYAGLGVEKPDGRTLEVAGLPGTVWSNVMQKAPEVLPEETQKVMYELASPESYADLYMVGDFNSIKWSDHYDIDRMDRMSYAEILKYTWQCFRYAPVESFEALAKLTDMVWAVDGKNEPILTYVNDNSWGISNQPFLGPRVFMKQIRDCFSAGFGRILFGAVGFELLIMWIAAVVMLVKGRSSFVHIIPLFCYDFGTMLLLSGEDYRFFLLNIPLWLTVLFIMIKDKGELPESKKAALP